MTVIMPAPGQLLGLNDFDLRRQKKEDGFQIAPVLRAVKLLHFLHISLHEFATNRLLAVVADGLDGTAFLGFFAAGFFLRILRLFVNKRITAIIVAFEIVRSGLAA
jgi:hypothetical protein